jgi:hypothetical protein
MNLLVTLLLTSVMTAHTVLGCCIHLDHGAHESTRNSADHHSGHHHGDPYNAPMDDHSAPQKCEKQCCIFIAVRAVQPTVDIADFVVPLVTAALHDPQDPPVIKLYAAFDEAHPHAGSALRIRQCVWLI